MTKRIGPSTLLEMTAELSIHPRLRSEWQLIWGPSTLLGMTERRSGWHVRHTITQSTTRLRDGFHHEVISSCRDFICQSRQISFFVTTKSGWDPHDFAASIAFRMTFYGWDVSTAVDMTKRIRFLHFGRNDVTRIRSSRLHFVPLRMTIIRISL